MKLKLLSLYYYLIITNNEKSSNELKIDFKIKDDNNTFLTNQV